MLLREGPDGVEVLVTRRHENLAFMGGLWVFPGGTLAAADTAAEALERIPLQSQAHCPRLTDLHGEALEPRQCLGLAVAAYRETFEETGILLATTAQGAYCAPDLSARMQQHRRAIVAQPELFARLLQQEDLRLDIDRLTYWAHWITPSDSPRRFDTRFFAVPVPPEQTARVDDIEAVEQAWMRPEALAIAAREGAMALSPPTWCTVVELAVGLREHGSLSSLLSTPRTIAPVLPKMLPGTKTILLPWDPEYPVTAGESAPASSAYSSALRNLPSRMTRNSR